MVFGLKLLQKKAPAEPPSNELVGPKGSSGGTKSTLTVNEFVARTKRYREKGLEPTKPELIAYARYLGIDPIVDGDLMWIADEALNAPLPSEWTEHHDSADRVFYYNVQTHASSWTHPLEQLHRDTYKTIVTFRSGDLSKEERAAELEKMRRKCEEAEQEAHKELQAWSEHTDEQGQKFFYNRDQQRSVWTDPRPSRCHALYLQMKALRVLSQHCGQSGGTSAREIEPLRGDRHREHRNNRMGDQDHPDRSARMKNHLPLGGGGAEGAERPHGGLGPLGGSSADDFAEQGESSADRERRKKKKRREQEGRDKLPLNELEGADAGARPPAPGNGFSSRGDAFSSPRGKKGGGLSAVDEVRGALGLNALPPHGDGGRGGSMPPLGGLGGRLPPSSSGLQCPDLEGDGLSSVGRVKVRAGIRLEPIRGGA